MDNLKSLLIINPYLNVKMLERIHLPVQSIVTSLTLIFVMYLNFDTFAGSILSVCKISPLKRKKIRFYFGDDCFSLQCSFSFCEKLHTYSFKIKMKYIKQIAKKHKKAELSNDVFWLVYYSFTWYDKIVLLLLLTKSMMARIPVFLSHVTSSLVQ